MVLTYKDRIKSILSELDSGDITLEEAENHLNRSTQSNMDEFGRQCFYDGRVYGGLSPNGDKYFKESTYNGYIRTLVKEKKIPPNF